MFNIITLKENPEPAEENIAEEEEKEEDDVEEVGEQEEVDATTPLLKEQHLNCPCTQQNEGVTLNIRLTH